MVMTIPGNEGNGDVSMICTMAARTAELVAVTKAFIVFTGHLLLVLRFFPQSSNIKS